MLLVCVCIFVFLLIELFFLVMVKAALCVLCIFCSIPKESIVDVEGVVVAVDQKVTSTSQQDVELHIEKVGIVILIDNACNSISTYTLKQLRSKKFDPFQPRVVFYIETSHLIYTANQMTGFYMKCNTGLK